MRMIIASAIKLDDGSVFIGKRHNDAINNAIKILKLNGEDPFCEKTVEAMWIKRAEQGFLTNDLRFITREQAMPIARRNGQFNKELHERSGYDGPKLFSEDLW